MALIFEFRKKPSASRKPVPVGTSGTGLIVFFTGVRYERIASADVSTAVKSAVSRKRSGHKRTKTMAAIA